MDDSHLFPSLRWADEGFRPYAGIFLASNEDASTIMAG
jgi:hypothetical protein